MDEIYKQAVALQYKFRDYLEDHNHTLASQLTREIQGLEDDVQVRKNPLTIEARAKTIINLLHSAEGTPVMQTGHAEDLRTHYQHLINDLRKIR